MAKVAQLAEEIRYEPVDPGLLPSARYLEGLAGPIVTLPSAVG